MRAGAELSGGLGVFTKIDSKYPYRINENMRKESCKVCMLETLLSPGDESTGEYEECPGGAKKPEKAKNRMKRTP